MSSLAMAITSWTLASGVGSTSTVQRLEPGTSAWGEATARVWGQT